MVEFLLDENILGLDRYLTGIKYKKIGDEGCQQKMIISDKKVVEYAMKNNLVIVTRWKMKNNAVC